MMPKAICEDCGSLVEAELTHNGVCEVGHYVHCGGGHDLSPDELISDYAAYRIEELEAKLSESEALLAQAVKLMWKDGSNPIGLLMRYVHIDEVGGDERTTFAELKGQDDE